MEVRLLGFLCLFAALLATGSSAKDKKAEDLAETYGDLLEPDADRNVQNDDIDDYGVDEVPEDTDDEKVEEIQAEIKTKPQVFSRALGETVLLPCNATSEDAVTMWQRGATYLFQGSIKMGKFDNIIGYPNNSLLVTLEKDEDFADYTCKLVISSENNPQIVHKVVKISPPKITSLYTVENRTVFQVGDTFTLVCQAEGYPTPEISWYKGNNEGKRLGIKGNSLTVERVTFEGAGMYRCLADNKNQPAAHKHIQINVEHKPVVHIEKFLVNSDKESDAELKCTVRSFPTATIIWKRNGQLIPNQPPRVKLERNVDDIDSILTITNLKEEDFGEYTCSATNRLGDVEKTVNLVKTPAVQEFLKPAENLKDVVLTWKVQSKAPISRHQLQYRKKGDEPWETIEPEVTKGEQDVYTVKYEIKNLDGGNYETRLRSENVHGWSEYSPVMSFESVLAKHGATHKNHNKKHHHKEKKLKEKNTAPSQDATPAQHQEIESKETPVGASQGSGSALAMSSAYLVSISLLFLFFKRP